MKTVVNLFWWAAYIVAALIVQQQIPGVDALAPGFLLSLQEKNRWQTFWLFLLFTLIQEGAGSLGFGSAMLWYGGQVALFRLTERLFIADNFLFVLMLSASLGVLRALVTWFMCLVQKALVDYMLLTQECLLQMMLIPIIWGIAGLLRPKPAPHSG